MCVKQCGVGVLLETDVGIFHCSKTSEMVVCVLQAGGTIWLTFSDEGILAQHILPQMNHGVLRVSYPEDKRLSSNVPG